MATVPSISGAQSASQFVFQQLKLQQAQRSADQAGQEAQALQNQANSARLTAQRAQENARALEVQSGQAQENAGRARQGLAALKSLSQFQTQLSGTLEKVAQAQDSVTPPPPPPQTSQPVVNTDGQVIGATVNVTA